TLARPLRHKVCRLEQPCADEIHHELVLRFGTPLVTAIQIRTGCQYALRPMPGIEARSCHTWRMAGHYVVAVILREADRLLLCHRAPSRRWYPDVWDFAGGHVEPGEQPEEALRREIAEELGVELEGVDGPPVLHRIVPETDLDLTVWAS